MINKRGQKARHPERESPALPHYEPRVVGGKLLMPGRTASDQSLRGGNARPRSRHRRNKGSSGDCLA